MIRMLVVLSLLLAQAPVSPAAPPPAPQSLKTCLIVLDAPAAPHSRTHFACNTFTPGQSVSVDRRWFKAHCQTYSDGSVRSCDAYAPSTGPTTKNIARPARHIVRNVALGAVVGVIVVACIAGGGCGALTGGE